MGNLSFRLLVNYFDVSKRKINDLQITWSRRNKRKYRLIGDFKKNNVPSDAIACRDSITSKRVYHLLGSP